MSRTITSLSSRERRSRLLRSQGITHVIDVGANCGQYGLELRDSGFDGRIVSFEPVAATFAQLAERAARDDSWEVHAVALGARDGAATINVSANTTSSSLLEWDRRLFDSGAGPRYVATEEVPVTTLAALWDELIPAGASAHLKIDVEGFELEVLEGAGDCIELARMVEVEVGLVPLWRGAPDLTTMVNYLAARGFQAVSIDAVTDDEQSGVMQQVDIVFARSSSLGDPDLIGAA